MLALLLNENGHTRRKSTISHRAYEKIFGVFLRKNLAIITNITA